MSKEMVPVSPENEPLCNAMESLSDHLDEQQLGHLAYLMSGRRDYGIVVVREHPSLAVPDEWQGFRVEVRAPEFGALRINPKPT